MRLCLLFCYELISNLHGKDNVSLVVAVDVTDFSFAKTKLCSSETVRRGDYMIPFRDLFHNFFLRVGDQKGNFVSKICYVKNSNLRLVSCCFLTLLRGGSFFEAHAGGEVDFGALGCSSSFERKVLILVPNISII